MRFIRNIIYLFIYLNLRSQYLRLCRPTAEKYND
jgi:hypothetical protein